MKSFISACAVACTAFAAGALAQPKINALVNNYSYVVPGLPNYGIAQGSIFIIFGTGLAASATDLTSPPPKSLNNVSVSVTMNGSTFQPLLYYAGPTQIDAILPSATPTGTGQITVTSNGQTSAPAPITVVQSAFGILTLNAAGNGPAAVFDYSFGTQPNYLGFTNAANAGDIITLWGTGAGPVDDDLKQSETSAPVEVDIGGVSADIKYKGRSPYPGLDQINVVVPQGVSGCYVSVVVRSGNYVSNFSSIPVAASGRTCSDQNTGFSASQLESLSGKSSFTVGALGLGKTNSYSAPLTVGGIQVQPGGTTTTDTAFAGFTKFTPEIFSKYSLLSGSSQSTSIGSCTVLATSGTSASSLIPPSVQTLNAGPISVTGPNGTGSLKFDNGVYGATLGGGAPPNALPIFIPDTGGSFTFNGSGGPDIGTFTTHLNLDSPLKWTEMETIGDINRSQGVTVTWTGGAADTYVVISGTSLAANGDTSLIGFFTCTAPVAAHTFSVPPSVLLALPASTGVSEGGMTINIGSSLTVSNYSNPQPFTAPNLDFGTASAYVSNSNSSVSYK